MMRVIKGFDRSNVRRGHQRQSDDSGRGRETPQWRGGSPKTVVWTIAAIGGASSRRRVVVW